MIHIVKGFGVVDETEVDVFLKFPSFLGDTVNVGNLISGSYSFSKPSLHIWKFLVHITLKAAKILWYKTSTISTNIPYILRVLTHVF